MMDIWTDMNVKFSRVSEDISLCFDNINLRVKLHKAAELAMEDLVSTIDNLANLIK